MLPSDALKEIHERNACKPATGRRLTSEHSTTTVSSRIITEDAGSYVACLVPCGCQRRAFISL